MTDDLTVRNPVATLQAVSHDPTCTQLIEFADGEPAHMVPAPVALSRPGPSATGGDRGGERAAYGRSHALVGRRLLDHLERDPMSAAREGGLGRQTQVLQAYRDRERLEWNDQAKAIDIQWSDVRADKGSSTNSGRPAGSPSWSMTDRMPCRHRPAEDTRAYFRGRCLAFPDNVVAASWDSVIVEIPGQRACTGCRCSNPVGRERPSAPSTTPPTSAP